MPAPARGRGGINTHATGARRGVRGGEPWRRFRASSTSFVRRRVGAPEAMPSRRGVMASSPLGARGDARVGVAAGWFPERRPSSASRRRVTQRRGLDGARHLLAERGSPRSPRAKPRSGRAVARGLATGPGVASPRSAERRRADVASRRLKQARATTALRGRSAVSPPPRSSVPRRRQRQRRARPRTSRAAPGSNARCSSAGASGTCPPLQPPPPARARGPAAIPDRA